MVHILKHHVSALVPEVCVNFSEKQVLTLLLNMQVLFYLMHNLGQLCLG